MESDWENIVIQKPLKHVNQNIQDKLNRKPPSVKLPRYDMTSSWLSKEIINSNKEQQKLYAFKKNQSLKGYQAEPRLTSQKQEAVLQSILKPSKSDFDFQPWRTPIQKRVESLQKGNEKLQKNLVQIYNDVHLRMYLLDVLKPTDYIQTEGSRLDASLLYWITSLFELDGKNMNDVYKLKSKSNLFD